MIHQYLYAVVPAARVYSIQFGIWPPQLHQHLHLCSTCTLVQPLLITGFKQPLHINDFITLDMPLFIPLHFFCTHFWQLLHCIKLLETPLPHTPHGHIAAFYITFCHSPLIITLVLIIFTLMPLFFTLSYHSLSLLIRSSSVWAIATKSSAYNSHDKATCVHRHECPY